MRKLSSIHKVEIKSTGRCIGIRVSLSKREELRHIVIIYDDGRILRLHNKESPYPAKDARLRIQIELEQ